MLKQWTVIVMMLVCVNAAVAGSAASPSPKPATAKEKMAAQFAARETEARATLKDLQECTARVAAGPARRACEKSITNLESALAKAASHAAASQYRRAFFVLGRPHKAAQASLKRCKSVPPPAPK